MAVFFTRSTNLTELAKAVKMLAALAPNESDSRQLLDSARMLAIATAKLLDAALPENLEVKHVFIVNRCSLFS